METTARSLHIYQTNMITLAMTHGLTNSVSNWKPLPWDTSRPQEKSHTSQNGSWCGRKVLLTHWIFPLLSCFKLYCITGNCRNVWHSLTWKLGLYLLVLPKQVSDCRTQSSLVGCVQWVNKQKHHYYLWNGVWTNCQWTSPKVFSGKKNCEQLGKNISKASEKPKAMCWSNIP